MREKICTNFMGAFTVLMVSKTRQLNVLCDFTLLKKSYSATQTFQEMNAIESFWEQTKSEVNRVVLALKY